MERLIARQNFTLFDPHEVEQVMGFTLKTTTMATKKEFTKHYLMCERARIFTASVRPPST